MVRRAAALLLITAVACTSHASPIEPASCEALGLSCTAKRLPNRVLHGDERDGALRSVDGRDLTGILTFDRALKRCWHEFHPDSQTIRVVLGSADATPLHWGRGRHLYYAIEYRGTCEDVSHPTGPTGPSPFATCVPGFESLILDAHSGRFIGAGGGTGS
jgi:hypothetical protein